MNSASALTATAASSNLASTSPLGTPSKSITTRKHKRFKQQKPNGNNHQNASIQNVVPNGSAASVEYSSLSINTEERSSHHLNSNAMSPLKIVLKKTSLPGSYSPNISNENLSVSMGSGGSSSLSPPPPLPLGDETYRMEYFNSLSQKRNKKDKKRKKHHHRHHHPNETTKLVTEDSPLLEVACVNSDLIVNGQPTLSNDEDSNSNLGAFPFVNGDTAAIAPSTPTAGRVSLRIKQKRSATPIVVDTPNGKSSSRTGSTRKKPKITVSVNGNGVLDSSSSDAPLGVLNEDISETKQYCKSLSFSPIPKPPSPAVTKTKPKKYSLYRRLLQAGHVTCDANNILDIVSAKLAYERSQSAHQKSTVTAIQRRRAKQLEEFLLELLTLLRTKDPDRYFAWPPNNVCTPGYGMFIKHPMDFSTIEKKIQHGLYSNVPELKVDVRLICANALHYYSASGRQYRQAAQLWSFAKSHVFHRRCLLKFWQAKDASGTSKYFYLTLEDLGLAPFPTKTNADEEQKPEAVGRITVNGEDSSTCTLPLSAVSLSPSLSSSSLSSVPLTLSALLGDVKSEPKPISPIRLSNSTTNGDSAPTLSGLLNSQNSSSTSDSALKQLLNTDSSSTPPISENDIKHDESQEVLARVRSNYEGCSQEQTESILQRVTTQRHSASDSISLSRQQENGSTTLGIVSSYQYDSCQMYTLGQTIGPLKDGTTSLSSYQEPETNRLRPVRSVFGELESSRSRGTSAFMSHLPYLDTTSSTMTLEESSFVLDAFGKFDTIFDQTIEKQVLDEDFMLSHVDALLDIVSNGSYSKPSESCAETNLVPSTEDDSSAGLVNQDNECEEESIQQKLKETDSLLQQLTKIQRERLCKTTEPIPPNFKEESIADQISSKLTTLIASFTRPQDVVDSETIRKVMGVHPPDPVDDRPS